MTGCLQSYTNFPTGHNAKNLGIVYVVYLAMTFLFGSLAIFCPSANFKLRQYSFIAIICIAARVFCQIKVTPTVITDRFAKYSTRQ